MSRVTKWEAYMIAKKFSREGLYLYKVVGSSSRDVLISAREVAKALPLAMLDSVKRNLIGSANDYQRII